MEIILPDRVKLHYDQAGSGHPTFIFVHGGGADTSHLAPQFNFFSAYGTAINIDLRGYGKSDKPRKYGTIEQYAEDIAHLCQHLDIKNPILIGHSMGGMVAVEFAAKYPLLPLAIVLISSGVLFPKAALDDEENVLRGLKSPTYRTAIQKLIDQICLPSDQFKSHIEDTFFAISQAQWISHFETMFAWNKIAPNRVKTCKLPMLYIEDSGGCYSDLTLFSKLCPQLIIGKVVGAGHFPTLEVPDQVNSMIAHFVKIYITNRGLLK
ncbi:alpha/beta hydrolase [Legionella donaldsonii]|uniref:Alpha/beta hydrolase n=1 Tax=Legionella donaldsonii TaxID=45060 RepID=A0A378J041_9GAMM|nr:alpha/beta hydrolase [Legionella donaldsonii]STX40756.1 alpha/beta hydrolase [Legionella donaldsonii]